MVAKVVPMFLVMLILVQHGRGLLVAKVLLVVVMARVEETGVVKSMRLHWMLASDSLQLQRERMAKVVPWQGAGVILLVTALQAVPL